MRDLIRMAGPRLPLPGGVRRTPKPPLVFRTHPTHRVRGSACSTPMNVLIMHSKLDNGPCKRSGNRNGRRHQLIELPQSTPLLVVPDRSGWRCWLGVGEAPRRGPSDSGSYRFHPRPSASCDRSRLGHRLGVRSSCQSSSASSATRVNARSTDICASCSTPKIVGVHTPAARYPATTARSTMSPATPSAGQPTSTT
jgi:hypothetical protein